MHQQQTLPLGSIQIAIQRQLGHPNNPIHGRPDFMTHIGQKLGFGPVSQLCRLPRSRILLDGIPQVEHHLINLSL